MTHPSYPGVYVEEVPSGVRRITGVATSITAFVGRAAAGPTDNPIALASFADFEHHFGGLDLASPMSYAVRDFFRNGGSHALIVRVVHSDATAATLRLPVRSMRAAELVLEASSLGAWGNRLSAVVDHDTDRSLPRASPPATDPQRFNLTVRYRPHSNGKTFLTENFSAVSTNSIDARYLPLVLEQESAYILVRGPMPETRPASNVTTSGKVRTLHWVHADPNVGSDGSDITDDDIIGSQQLKTGLYALNRADAFNLLCIPPRIRDTSSMPSTYEATSTRVYEAALALCVERRAMLIVDPDPAWAAQTPNAIDRAIDGRNALGIAGPAARNAALYFPCVRQVDPLRNRRVDTFVPSGAMAGIIARTDAQRAVWKAPAGLEATLTGVTDLQVNISDPENARLTPLAINGLRSLGARGRVVWGARTWAGVPGSTDEYKYIPVRRLGLFIEESLYRGTKWAVFEPNDEPLWAQLRLNVGAFMHELFRQGAFQGASPDDAYFVKCDRTTTTQHDITLGRLNVLVGFAPTRPAEFVLINIRQRAGQIAP